LPDTYSKSKGLFAGISLEGTLLFQRGDCNKAKYGEGVTGEMILKGQVPRPANSDVSIVQNSSATQNFC
jgi:lipid-binding SYLF domain-containing protein